LKGAYQCNLVCVPHDFATMQEALAATAGKKVFLMPPGRVETSVEFADWVMPNEDIVFVFGSPQDNLVSSLGADEALHITTQGTADMMAVCVAGVVMYVHG